MSFLRFGRDRKLKILAAVPAAPLSIFNTLAKQESVARVGFDPGADRTQRPFDVRCPGQTSLVWDS